jgi:hypothetical protein
VEVAQPPQNRRTKLVHVLPSRRIVGRRLSGFFFKVYIAISFILIDFNLNFKTSVKDDIEILN